MPEEYFFIVRYLFNIISQMPSVPNCAFPDRVKKYQKDLI
jgi:hypothetical protein